MKHFRARAVEYLCNKFGWTPVEAEAKRKEALRVRNQTVLGLKALGHDFDDFEFVEYMREGEDRFLEPNPTLRAMLEALPQKKYIFTNTRSEPAKRALKCLGIEDLFAGGERGGGGRGRRLGLTPARSVRGGLHRRRVQAASGGVPDGDGGLRRQGREQCHV